MKKITFITGNQKKANFLERYLEHPILHHKVDLDEVQSLDLKKIVKHKVRQAFDIIKGPVIVEDTSLEFKAFGKLPGPFIKFFLEQMSADDICLLLKDKDRSARASCVFGYFDGEIEKYFENGIDGTIAEKSSGDAGFGFDKIFIPEGYNITRADLNEEDQKIVYLKMKPIMQVKDFLMTLE